MHCTLHICMTGIPLVFIESHSGGERTVPFWNSHTCVKLKRARAYQQSPELKRREEEHVYYYNEIMKKKKKREFSR